MKKLITVLTVVCMLATPVSLAEVDGFEKDLMGTHTNRGIVLSEESLGEGAIALEEIPEFEPSVEGDGENKNLELEFGDAEMLSEELLGEGAIVLEEIPRLELLAEGDGENETLEFAPVEAETPNAGTDIAIDAQTFPDLFFRIYISRVFDTDGNGYLSEQERLLVTQIPKDNTWSSEPSDNEYLKKVKSYQGLEHFENLMKFSCYSDHLPELDVSTLRNLKDLSCSGCNLEKLTLNAGLEELYCNDNALTELDVSRCDYLRNLECRTNKLTSLDLKMNVQLDDLDCSDNQLKKLTLCNMGALRWLNCSYNLLTSLNANNGRSLLTIDCSNNRLSSLDVSKCYSLLKLKCANNNLKKLTLGTKGALEELYCEKNSLEKLDIGGCPVIRNEITCVLSGYNKTEKTVEWGDEFRDYDPSASECFIRIDRKTKLLSRGTLLYKSGTAKNIGFTRKSGKMKQKTFVNLGKYLKMSPSGVASICKLASSNKKIIIVNNSGFVYAKKKGKATVAVAIPNGRMAKISITVK